MKRTIKLTKNESRFIQNVVDKCIKEGDSANIYKIMDTFRTYLKSSLEVREYIHDIVQATLLGEDPNMRNIDVQAPATRKRSKQIKFYVSDEEKKIIDSILAHEKVTATQFFIDICKNMHKEVLNE